MNEITYTRIGDYELPNITLSEPSPQSTPPLGKYGMMHKEYLRIEKPALYTELLLTEQLYSICREIDEAAANRLKSIPDSNASHEIILSELVYC